MVNEHHSTATCLSVSVTLTLAVLARVTQRARLLCLGVPLPNRPDPVRVAEELAMIDVMSRGRLDMGFVRSTAVEIAVAVTNPLRMSERLWEAHDLILKAMTSHDGPFGWEGRYFQYRNVNIWPRPYQQPHPPVWITAMSIPSVKRIAEHNHVLATFLTGYNCKALFDAYRAARKNMGQPEPNTDRFGYMGLLAVARTEDEAMRRAEAITEYVRTTSQISLPFKWPPGYNGVESEAKRLQKGPIGNRRIIPTKDGGTVAFDDATPRQLIDNGCLFAGTPEQVARQMLNFSAAVGGIGNMLVMGHGGRLSQSDTLDSLTLFGKEVLPRLQHATRESTIHQDLHERLA
jgi:alkanesulfonate monooxygenase SsuD/methylene tetrahydromethanopterin reductase-like flavin-dependent oxidoreductase (luciferase family)